MTTEVYNLVFKGELVRGSDPVKSRRNIGNLFKISDDKVEVLFSGKPVVLKKNLDFATANKYRVAIKKAGCRVDVVEVKPEAKEQAKSQGKASFAAAEAENEAPKAKPISTESSASTAPKDIHVQSASQNAPALSEPKEERPPLPDVEEVVAPAVVSTVSVDTSSLSLAPTQGNLVDSSEIERPEPIDVTIGDLDVQAPGEDLLHDDEKTPFVERDIAMDADVAPAGAILLREDEREHAEAVQVDVSGLSIAEPGVDLGQEREEKKELKPDISHLALE